VETTPWVSLNFLPPKEYGYTASILKPTEFQLPVFKSYTIPATAPSSYAHQCLSADPILPFLLHASLHLTLEDSIRCCNHHSF